MATLRGFGGNKVWNNAHVALMFDVVFGVMVHSETGWVPWSEGDEEEQANIRHLVAKDPHFLPQKIADVIYGGEVKESTHVLF